MTGVLTRWALLTGSALWLVALLAAPADAHARLVDADPADGQVLAQAPKRITLRFDESVTEPGARLIDPDGDPAPVETTVRGSVVTVTVESPLADGSYALSWRALSADGHPVSGDLRFAVGAPSDDAPTTPSDSAERETTVLTVTAEAVRYGGVLVLAGLTAFGVIARPVTRRDPVAARRLLRAAELAGGAAAVGATALIVLPAVTGPAVIAGVAVLLGVPAVLIGLRWSALAVAGAGAGFTLASLLVEGHTRSHGPAWLVLPADLAHVSAAAVWAGGVVGLLVLFSLRTRPGDLAQTVARFSTVAMWSLGLLLAAAAVLYWRIAGSLDPPWRSGYGWIVLAKASATAVIIGLGGWNRRRLTPRVDRSPHAARTLRRIVGVEAGLLALIVVLTGVLVGADPGS